MDRTELEKEMETLKDACDILEKQVDLSSQNVNQLIQQQQETNQFYNTKIEVFLDHGSDRRICQMKKQVFISKSLIMKLRKQNVKAEKTDVN